MGAPSAGDGAVLEVLLRDRSKSGPATWARDADEQTARPLSLSGGGLRLFWGAPVASRPILPWVRVPRAELVRCARLASICDDDLLLSPVWHSARYWSSPAEIRPSAWTSARNWRELGRNLADLADLAQRWPNSARCWPTPALIRPRPIPIQASCIRAGPAFECV